MTVLILSLWAFGVLLLIVVAVYRGKSAVKTAPAEMSSVDISEMASELGLSRQRVQEILRDAEDGPWRVVVESSSEYKLRDQLVTKIAEEAIRSGPKGAHVPFPKPGKSVR
ncbi:hypothetical protein KW846_03800 [Pseudomonas sp. PDM32]|uniref:hypothetical protein n=1 Tax=Pseudomonas sp. PDM32 TaxID=2854768 RepID=UPI001C49550F|nr:hypothetical protein [Pseudomonas sp. PDM32]MBV7571816.1 hypothetical protein [Pseudomonas sp. PDM32]